MAWLGVPFVGSGWDSSLVGKASFWQQFIDQFNARIDAAVDWDNLFPAPLPTQGLEVEIGHTIGAGANVDLNLAALRRVPRSVFSAFGNPPAVGQTWASLTTGKDQVFLDRVNGFLTAAGCPAMGSTLQADFVSGSHQFLGIPWTRKFGNPDSPTTANGEPQNGDILGPWIFNEWYAVQSCLNFLVRLNFSGSDSGLVRDASVGSTTGVFLVPTSAAAALSAAVSGYASAPSYDFVNNPRETAWQSIQETSPGQFASQVAKARRSFLPSSFDFGTDHARPNIGFPAYIAHVPKVPLISTSLTLGFEDFGEGLTVDQVAFVDEFSAWSPSAGLLESTPHIDLASPPSTPQVPTGTLRGYALDKIAVYSLNIPPP